MLWLLGSHYAGLWTGTSILILGSEDRRYGLGFVYGYSRADPRLRWGTTPGAFGIEGYAELTHSDGASGAGANDRVAVGLLSYARYSLGGDAYGEFGLGIQYNNRTSVDISGLWMFTPAIGAGWSFSGGLELGFRWMHISNAGLSGNNQGQNQLRLWIGHRF